MSDATTQPLKPFKAQYTLSFDALDLTCAGKQNRDALEALEDLGFVLETAAFGEPGAVRPGEIRERLALRELLLGGAAVDAMAERLYLNYCENPVLWRDENPGAKEAWIERARDYLTTAWNVATDHSFSLPDDPRDGASEGHSPGPAADAPSGASALPSKESVAA